jgi:hypothetical protein
MGSDEGEPNIPRGMLVSPCDSSIFGANFQIGTLSGTSWNFEVPRYLNPPFAGRLTPPFRKLLRPS